MDYPVQFKSLKPFALLINLHPIERVLTSAEVISKKTLPSDILFS
jgi:hypothetical protein